MEPNKTMEFQVYFGINVYINYIINISFALKLLSFTDLSVLWFYMKMLHELNSLFFEIPKDCEYLFLYTFASFLDTKP